MCWNVKVLNSFFKDLLSRDCRHHLSMVREEDNFYGLIFMVDPVSDVVSWLKKRGFISSGFADRPRQTNAFHLAAALQITKNDCKFQFKS